MSSAHLRSFSSIVLWSIVAFGGLGLVGCGGTADDSAATAAADDSHADEAHDDDGDAHSASADAGHDDHGPAHGGLDPDLAIVTGLVFLILLTVLSKFAWGPIVEVLERREKTIADEIASAEQQNAEARKLLADHEARLAGTADEVRRLLDDARNDADQQKQKIVAEAQQVATAEKQRAVQEIQAAKNSALQDIAQKSVDTAVDLAGQIVQRQLNPEDHANLIGDALRQFPSKN